MKTVEVLAISMPLLGNTVYGDCLLSRDEQASTEINVSIENKRDLSDYGMLPFW